ncbi:MAG: DUF4954 family protein [Bacteroidales bacterium]|jgi:hypothetical protein|nr:DUF4954 family protein [Bacteroidales bacterium]
MNYRNLTEKETEILTAQGCRCENWQQVKVDDGFNPCYVRDCIFSGNIRMGAFAEEITFAGGVKKHCGISDARLHNCHIGNNTYIARIGNYIANYDIADHAVIENVDVLATDSASSFGNGTPATVLNESGGREVPIFDRLSAHLAYLIAVRKSPATEKIVAMIRAYAASVTSERGVVGEYARVRNSRSLHNLRIGAHSVIEGASRLANGTVVGDRDAPAYIGTDVIAENFIVASGAVVTDGAAITNTFVGQGCLLSKQFSAENSLFFSNCLCLHGEACSALAGPYTVTHHKSTLLIAGCCSFMNAGSGFNQSNHMYKLGAVHWGIMERGLKAASNAYLKLPAQMGAFTLVAGRHGNHPDTSLLPFSYLIESEGDSLLVPGVSLRSAGVVRDTRKWIGRDARNPSNRLDHINFSLLNPYTVGKMMKGLDLLQKLTQDDRSNISAYQGVKITADARQKGIRLYRMGICLYLGDKLMEKLENIHCADDNTVRQCLQPVASAGKGDWTDLAGLIVPESETERLINDIETNKIASLEAIAESFADMHRNCDAYAWTWAIGAIRQFFDIPVEQFTAQDVIRIAESWSDSVIAINEMICNDAQKDLALANYGKHAGQANNFDDNPFIREIRDHSRKTTERRNRMIERMRQG